MTAIFSCVSKKSISGDNHLHEKLETLERPGQGCLKGGNLIGIQRINHYPVDSVVCFVNAYPLERDLSAGERYPAFQQLGSDLQGRF